MTVKRNGVPVVNTDDCPDCPCSQCRFRCYERDAMNLHDAQIRTSGRSSNEINND